MKKSRDVTRDAAEPQQNETSLYAEGRSYGTPVQFAAEQGQLREVMTNARRFKSDVELQKVKEQLAKAEENIATLRATLIQLNQLFELSRQ